jgi:hypothetical protein
LPEKIGDVNITLLGVNNVTVTRLSEWIYCLFNNQGCVLFMAENEIIESTSDRIVNCDMILTMSVVDDLVFRVEHLTDKLQFR